jgi:hypothetical protein
MHELLESLHGTGASAVLKTVAAAIFWGMWRFTNHYWKKGEPFDVPRFLSLLVVSVLIGVTNALMGTTITEANFAVQIAAYMPLVGIVDNVISNALMKYKGGKYDRLYNGFKHVARVDVDGDGEAETPEPAAEPVVTSGRMQEKVRELKKQADGWPGLNENEEPDAGTEDGRD